MAGCYTNSTKQVNYDGFNFKGLENPRNCRSGGFCKTSIVPLYEDSILVFFNLCLFQPCEFVGQLTELGGEPVHGLLKGGQKVEGHDDGEAYGGDGGQEGLSHSLGQDFLVYIFDVDFLGGNDRRAVDDDGLLGDDVGDKCRDVSGGDIFARRGQ